MELPTWLRSQLGHRVVRAWESLSEGWRELLSPSGGALTPFAGRRAGAAESDAAQEFARWGLLAGETCKTSKNLIIRLEIAGVEKDDLEISIYGNLLRIRGEKHSTAEQEGKIYHLMERAYGRFERTIPLPHDVDDGAAEVSVADGVVTVILPKKVALPLRQLRVP